MKLNQEQRVALAIWLGSKVPNLAMDHAAVSRFNEFCDGEIKMMTEWRIIYNFGLAGKIWNVHDSIYVTGYSQSEIGKRQYNKQQEIIEKWNKEISELIVIYACFS